jgi:hypothetical protein
MKFLLSIALIVLFVPFALAQKAKTILSKSDYEVGEKIMLTYMLLYNEKLPFQFDANKKNTLLFEKMNAKGVFVEDTSSSLEMLKPLKDTLIKESGQQLWTGVFEIMAWDTGTYKLPDVSVNFNGGLVKFPSAIFKAHLVAKNDSTDIYNIKEEFAEIPKDLEEGNLNSKSNSYWWFLVWTAIVVFAFIIIRWMLKRKSNISVEQSIDFQTQTLQAIEELERKQLWLKGKEKQHYSELSYHLRSYFAFCFGLNLLEKTTQETVLLLKQCGLETYEIGEIRALLNGADLVKFAQSKPEEDWNIVLLKRAKVIVQKIKPTNTGDAE